MENRMNERLEVLRKRVRGKKTYRQGTPLDLISKCEAEGLSWMQRAARLTCRMCEAEQPLIFPGENILFTRTISSIPPLYSPTRFSSLTQGRVLHELGPVSNICPDWGFVLSQGLFARRDAALVARQNLSHDSQAVEFLDCAVETIDAILRLAGRYSQAARDAGRLDLALILDRVPALPPRTFHEALQSQRLLHAVVWLSGHYHVGLGRFDQYMWPYLEADLESGRLDLAGAEELLAEFFISLNKDSDLYPGVQQGDNGQTLTLGGVSPQGHNAINELTRLSLRVSRDLALIDPKINLRISGETDLELLCLATELTRMGIGFPQYSNDEIIIPALVAHGYELEDARNYTVAACWEFIIPGKGMEVVNIGAVSFPAAADKAIREGLRQEDGFEEISKLVKKEIYTQVDSLVKAYQRLLLPPAPYYSLLFEGCLERGRDLSEGLKYNNFGIHGAGSANAADALAAVRRFVFDEGCIEAGEMLHGLESDFQDDEPLRRKLLEKGPKVGKNSILADEMLTFLFDAFAEACEAHVDNGRGGILRPGSGSAMYYIWLAQGHEGMREPLVGATADGRHTGQPFSANLAPSTGINADGPLSIFHSFSKIDYRRIYNGGPVTLELSNSVFRNSESIEKVALLIRAFCQLGLQQLQLNTLNPEMLLEAKAHPELHKNLIVRVWGWSAYFCELSPEYQDHIIARQMHLAV
jgi:pyruvate-formate lyase